MGGERRRTRYRCTTCRRYIGSNGHKRCRKFLCPTCKRVVGWETGGTDSLDCADCWVKKTAECIAGQLELIGGGE